MNATGLLKRRQGLRRGVNLTLMEVKASAQSGCGGYDGRKGKHTHYNTPYCTPSGLASQLTTPVLIDGDVIATVGGPLNTGAVSPSCAFSFTSQWMESSFGEAVFPCLSLRDCSASASLGSALWPFSHCESVASSPESSCSCATDCGSS